MTIYAFLTVVKCSNSWIEFPFTAGTKSVCIVAQDMNQADADKYCKSGGMKLLQIDSAATQTSIIALLNTNFQGQQYYFRVDGLRDESGDNQWYYYNNGKAPAFVGLDWYVSYDTLLGRSSLAVTNSAYPMNKLIPSYKIDGVDPVAIYPCICEF